VEEKISEELENVGRHLKKLPPQISNPQKEFLDLLREFTRALSQTTDGEREDGRFVHSTINIFREFRSQLLATIPTFDIQVTNKDVRKLISLTTPELSTPSDDTQHGLVVWPRTNPFT
jgi:hypothetical protein